jgi:hypothetical protein
VDSLGWDALVRRTQQEPDFAAKYTFPDSPGWAATEPKDVPIPGMPEIVAVDCEMCVVEDPVVSISMCIIPFCSAV